MFAKEVNSIFSRSVSLTPAFFKLPSPPLVATIFAGWDPNPLQRVHSFLQHEHGDLVSLTKPFSQFVVVHMNIHALFLGTVSPHEKHNDCYFFLFSSTCFIPLCREQWLPGG